MTSALEFAGHELARASLDHCVKCTICETQCPVAAVTTAFPGPKFIGPQAERFRHGEPV
ncbi:MAG: anaerobic glycerol-3-phosphate dehydrogenase subunit C, partial [Propionibacteriaceae bacterium]|nr:anaerobic glycerol-3-phosphate dehydrogenase subunit C [Propionibacteriaceae bacterium]